MYSQNVPLPTTDFILFQIPYEYEECGKSRSCMGEPEHCVLNEACNILLTYHPSEEEDGIEFEMLYAGKGYVSIGFSDDFDKMVS